MVRALVPENGGVAWVTSPTFVGVPLVIHVHTSHSWKLLEIHIKYIKLMRVKDTDVTINSQSHPVTRSFTLLFSVFLCVFPRIPRFLFLTARFTRCGASISYTKTHRNIADAPHLVNPS